MNTTDPNALDPTATTPPPALVPVVDLMTEPPLEEIIEEWNRYHEDAKAGRLDYTNVLANNYFAYYGGRIIDSDPEPIVLQHRAAEAIGVHWARLVIRYRGEPGIVYS